MNSASFTPVTVTVETLQVLSKEENYANLLALYMACVEITTWQKDNSIKASLSFMMKRLKWGEPKVVKSKARLVELGLLETVVRRGKDGKVEGYYTLVKHVLQPVPLSTGTSIHHALDSGGTNANDYQLNANDYKTSLSSFGEKKNNSPVVAKNTTLLEEIIKIVNPREKVTQERLRVLNGRMKDYTHDEIVASARAFSQSAWHRNNKQMSIDNLIAPSKFGRWYGQRDESTPVDGPPPRITEDDDGRHYYRGTLMTIYNRDELLAQQAREEAEWDAKVAARGTE